MEEYDNINELISKKALKRESNRIGFALLLFLLLQFVAYILFYIVNIIFSKDGIANLFEGNAISLLSEQVVMMCSYSVSALATIAVLNKGQS